MLNKKSDKKFVYQGKDLESMSFANNYHQWIYDEIKSFTGTKIAEIGSGIGNFTQFLLQDNNAVIHAFEPCRKMHDASMHLNHKSVVSINENFENLTSNHKGQFDSVVFINVLEHIEDDKDALEASMNIIRENGHLIIFVPALMSIYSAFDRSIGHFRRYRKSQLIKLVRDTGFTVNACKYFDSLGVIPWLIFMKLLGGSLNHRSVKIYDSYMVPLVKYLESICSPPVGKNLLIVASKS